MSDTSRTAVFKALADPNRLAIVRTLAGKPEGELSCNILDSCSKLSQPAMSHHFHKLVEADILYEHKVGTQKRYVLNAELLFAAGLDVHRL